jgi:lipopolysaccharide transport system permease protein
LLSKGLTGLYTNCIMARLIIESGRTEQEYWRDLWRYRELFYVLAWRDISVRYKQTVVGVLWALLQPFVTMIVFTVIFGKLAKMPSQGVPYPLLVFAGMLPWQFVSSSLTNASQSLVINSTLISKVYFPRLIIPTSTVVTAFVDLLIAFILMVGTMLLYHYSPPWQVITLPIFILLAFLSGLGPGLLITALNVKYRDFRYIIPFIIQIGVYVSPVGFSSAAVSEKWGEQWRLLYSLNPVVGVIDGFRWCLLGGENTLYLPGFFLSLVVTVILLWLGIVYFRRTERTFADII